MSYQIRNSTKPANPWPYTRLSIPLTFSSAFAAACIYRGFQARDHLICRALNPCKTQPNAPWEPIPGPAGQARPAVQNFTQHILDEIPSSKSDCSTSQGPHAHGPLHPRVPGCWGQSPREEGTLLSICQPRWSSPAQPKAPSPQVLHRGGHHKPLLCMPRKAGLIAPPADAAM